MYAYLIENEKVAKSYQFEDLYRPGHPISNRFSSKKRSYFVGISQEKISELSRERTRWLEMDNPVIHEPSLTVEYLTDYILSKKNDAIVGKVVYSRTTDEYIGTLEGGKILFVTHGQTGYDTLSCIEFYRNANWSELHYLWSLKMMFRFESPGCISKN